MKQRCFLCGHRSTVGGDLRALEVPEAFLIVQRYDLLGTVKAVVLDPGTALCLRHKALQRGKAGREIPKPIEVPRKLYEALRSVHAPCMHCLGQGKTYKPEGDKPRGCPCPTCKGTGRIAIGYPVKNA